MAANCKIQPYDYKKLNNVFFPSELEKYSKLTNILVGEVIFKVNEKLNLSVLDLDDKTQIEDIYEAVRELLANVIEEKENPGTVDDSFLPSLFNADAIKKISKRTLNNLIKLEDNFDLFKIYHLENAGVFKKGPIEQSEDEDIPETPIIKINDNRISFLGIVNLKDN